MAQQNSSPQDQQAPDGQQPRGAQALQPPAINLPKGGGAIRGMGEKFAANPVTGTGSMSVPIATSPGRSGFGPELSLSYDSGAGNGPFGFGWSLSMPSITRKPIRGCRSISTGGRISQIAMFSFFPARKTSCLSSQEMLLAIGC
jgi:hypothetical protein